MQKPFFKLERLSNRAILASMLMLGLFLGYYIHLAYQREALQMQREASYLFDNAVKQVEGSLLTDLVFAKLDSIGYQKDSSDILGETIIKMEKRSFKNIDLHQHKIEIESISKSDTLSHFREDSIQIMVGVLEEVLDSQRLIALVEEQFEKNLSNANLNVNYKIIYEDSLHNNSMWEILSQSDSTGSKLEKESSLDITSKRWAIIKKIWPDILLSLTLFGAIGLAFFFLYKRIEREKEISNAKNEFVQNITHELKTPLSTLSIAAEAISSQDLNMSKTRNYLDIIGKESYKLNSLVDEILTVQKIEEGSIKQSLETVDVGKLLMENIDEWKNLYKPIQFHENIGQNILAIANHSSLNKILENIIENAVKYNDKEECVISIYCTESKNYISVHFLDNGPGIPINSKEDVFEKFFRVPTGNTHNVKGHGLGLYFAKKMALNLGGDLSIEHSDSGAHFVVKLRRND